MAVAPPNECASACRRLRLRSGNSVAVAEYGAHDGAPIFFCHGWPSSRTMAELTDAAARELGLRIISLDRPGIRDSSFHARRTLLDWPPLLAEVADSLGAKEFRMLAISGGAPYAFAAAWALPERVRAIAVVSGAPPLAELRERSGLLPLYRWMLHFYPRHRQLLRCSFHLARPFLARRLPMRLRPALLKALQPCDAEVLRNAAAFEACFESQRQAWRASAEGVLADAEIYAQPWGFPLEEVSVAVRLWHGKKDRTFHWHLARSLAARLPNCAPRFVEAEGHYSLAIRRIREILADLQAA